MAEIDPVILELRADLSRYKAELRSTTSNVESLLGRQEKSARRLEAEMKRSSGAISNTIKGLAGTLAAAFSGRELAGLIDSFTRLQNNLRVAGQEGESLARVQENLLGISRQYGVDVETLSGVFLKASLAQNELGASTEQIIRLNEIVAASLKITGTSAEQARGALLQLGQSLGSDVVRGEEFNSLLENALPLVQAAANGIERMGGSVAKLRQEVVNSNVTSKEFFDGILVGGIETIKQAEDATLTLSGAFEALRSELTVYVGEAASANGVTGAMASAIKSLADNLTTLIPVLAIVATGLGVGIVTNAVRARLATVALGTAAAATGRTLLAAFGGPIGIALTTVAVGLAYVASSSSKAEAEAAALSAAIRDNAQKLGTLSGETENATAKTENLSAAEVQAAATAAGLTVEAGRLTDQRYRQAAATRAAYIEELKLQAAQAGRSFKEAKRAADRTADGLGDPGYGGGYAGLGGNVRQSIQGSDARRQVYIDLLGSDVAQDFKQALANLDAARNAPLELPGVPGTTAGKPGKPAKAAKGRAGPDPEAEARRAAQALAAYLSELDQLNADELALKADLNGKIEDRRDAELARIDAVQAAFNRQVELDDQITDAQRQKLIEENGQVADLQRERAKRQATLDLLDQTFRLESDANRLEQDIVRSQLDLAESREEQKALAQRLLDLQHSQEQAELERLVQTLELNGIQSEELIVAKARLARLKTLQDNDQKGLDRDFESPFQRYARDLGSESLEDRAEKLVIEEIEDVRRGMRNAISDAIGTDDPFITGLIDLLLQDLIFKPLADSLAKGGGGFSGLLSGIGSLFGSIFGRSSGGYVGPGQLVRVNEGASPGRVEGFRSAGSGEIIPLGQMNALAGQRVAPSAAPAVVRLQLSGDLDARIVEKSSAVVVQFERAVGEQRMRETAAYTIGQATRPKL